LNHDGRFSICDCSEVRNHAFAYQARSFKFISEKCGSIFAFDELVSFVGLGLTSILRENTMLQFVSGLVGVVLAMLCLGSLFNVSSHPHWFIRGWDFPRLQILVLGWLLCAAYFALRKFSEHESDGLAIPVVLMGIFLTGWHGFHILPYTFLFSKQVKSTALESSLRQAIDHSDIRLVVSNVELENDQYERWMATIEAADPDILVVLEVDDRWVRSTNRLIEKYRYRVIQPQSNWYGMMLLSRLPIEASEVRYLVQSDVPSIDATIRLEDQTQVRLIAVHPRPPEPIRGNHAVARDAELAIWGQELARETRPVLICGDLNDVAWSRTTRLFLRTSKLLDPRCGRGLFNTFNAKHPFLRFPVDHVFVSKHFTVNGIHRLPFVGSDHFPMQLELRFNASRPVENELPESKPSDHADRQELIQRALEDPALDGEAVDTRRPTNVTVTM
jgi:endonuclease/exonuclease/phosphatase (EEP) superfamily protein YafD